MGCKRKREVKGKDTIWCLAGSVDHLLLSRETLGGEQSAMRTAGTSGTGRRRMRGLCQAGFHVSTGLAT